MHIARKMKFWYILAFYNNTREDNEPNLIFVVCPLELIENVTQSCSFFSVKRVNSSQCNFFPPFYTRMRWL